MKRDKSRKRMDSDHLQVANPIRPEDLDRRVMRQGVYPSLPASHGVPWSTYVRSQKPKRISPRSVSSSTEALDSDQARQTTRRILQHTRSLPTSSPEPHIQSPREYRSDSGLSDRYTTRIPIVASVDRSSYRSSRMEQDDYARLGSRTPSITSMGMIVRPRTKLTSSYGSLPAKGTVKDDSVVMKSPTPIIGEGASVFTDMTDTMLKVLDRRSAIAAQARELENTLAEKAYALGQQGQKVTGYLPTPVTSTSLSAQPYYMNTRSKMTVGIPMAESTPVPQMGPIRYRPTPTPRVSDILEPIASEQARAQYLDEQMRHMQGIRLTPPESWSLDEGSLSREIQEYCSHMSEHCQCEKETHYAMLDSMIDNKIQQKQLQQKERDEIYKQMTSNLEKVKSIARDSLSRASTISVDEHQMALSRTDFLHIKEKMTKIDQRIDSLYRNWQAEQKEAITSEQCDAIQRHYEPYVGKYEMKYKVLYHTLQQAIMKRTKVPSSKVSASELTPSLVALEDATALKKKEWDRAKSGIEKAHMFSTKEGRLTPTAPTYEDMRTATPFHATTTKSQEGLSSAEGGVEIVRVKQTPLDHTKRLEPSGVPPVSITVQPEVSDERFRPEDTSGRTEVTRETSREDALASTRRFFGNGLEERTATEVPVITTTAVSMTPDDTPPVTSVPVVMEHPEPSPSTSRVTLPNGTSPRPVATATLRPRTLTQIRSEGQVEEQ